VGERAVLRPDDLDAERVAGVGGSQIEVTATGQEPQKKDMKGMKDVKVMKKKHSSCSSCPS
jgi:hypothetical protein